MKKEIKDYLHLYLGVNCLVMGQSEEEYTFTGISFDDTQKIWWVYFENTEFGYAVIDDVKPILRPLSDMTEDEAVEFIKIITVERRWESIDIHEMKDSGIWYSDGSRWQADGVDELNDLYIEYGQLNAYQFQWLLSKHFDLFGLIETGLAIDKTKMNSEQKVA